VSRWRKLLFALIAASIAAVVAMLAIEVWVRATWDDTKGRPGFFVTDAHRGQRLSAGYDGWFAGVPVHINSLGFRDRRDYSLDKPPNTFRILVLGDSVTFGHGTLDETTYPFLLEQALRQWRPSVNWEVWNLGVPGYNTGQELAYLREIGPRARPDLVIVGFFPNDFTGDNDPEARPSMARRLAAPIVAFAQRHLYSFEFYKKVLLTAQYRFTTTKDDRLRLEHLSTEEELLQRKALASDDVQRLTAVDYLDDPHADTLVCSGVKQTADGTGSLAAQLRGHNPEYAEWRRAVEAFQDINRRGDYRIMFFINMSPVVCPALDRFVDGGTLEDDAALIEIMGQGTPVASVTRAFLHYRPSQMPGATAHSIGNANRVKAETLFHFLQQQVLPPLLPTPQ
jgi:hypothetical protein